MRVYEIFYSIQGEGLNMGQPTAFIRLAGCNLRCAWCDTECAQPYDSGESLSIELILASISHFNADHVCLTGGEPLHQKEGLLLLERLLALDLFVTLETNGSIDLHVLGDMLAAPNLLISMDYKCPSSGMTDKMLASNFGLLRDWDQLKFVIADENDYDAARQIIGEKIIPASIIFTPAGGIELKWLAERVLADGLASVRVLPQLHKIIWEDAQGK